jgi:hypothetical protein
MVRTHRKRPGNVCVLAAFCITVLVGVAAIAIDGGLLMDDVQKLQAAADASALAGAEQLYTYWQTANGFDSNGQATSAALALASTNGYPNDGVDSVITPNAVDSSGNLLHGIWCPPISGDHVGEPGYIEVVIQYNQKRHFSAIYGSQRIPARARAVAEGGWRSGRAGILILDPTSPGALTVNGNGSVSVVGAPLIVDSNASNGGVATGNATVTISSNQEIDFSGSPGISGSGSWIGPIKTNQPPVPDPLLYLPEPSTSGGTSQPKFNISGKQSLTINPGVYNGGISVSGQASLYMNPGIYYMAGGGFSFTGQGDLTANGVMIVNLPTSKSDTISINGQGTISLSPMTTGIYRGISLWQQRSSSNTINVTGNGSSTMSGTFYTAHGTLNVTGNGNQDVLGSQYISYDMKVNGNGSFKVDWDPDLVGRVRILRLVE